MPRHWPVKLLVLSVLLNPLACFAQSNAGGGGGGGSSGVGMVLGHASVVLFYIIGLGVVVLGIALFFGMRKAGKLRRDERERLDQNARMAQRRDDPDKRADRGAASW